MSHITSVFVEYTIYNCNFCLHNNPVAQVSNHYMGVNCYVEYVGLLSLDLSGLKKILKLCEDYALKHKIIFNASKTLFLYFSPNTISVLKDFFLG